MTGDFDAALWYLRREMKALRVLKESEGRLKTALTISRNAIFAEGRESAFKDELVHLGYGYKLVRLYSKRERAI